MTHLLRSISKSLALNLICMTSLSLMLVSCATSASRQAKESGTYKGYGQSSLDPKTLAEFAPPPLSKDLSDFVTNLLEVQAPGSGILTPNGQTLFFSWQITGSRQIWKAERPLGFPVQMTSGVDTTSVVDVAPDGKYIILQRDEGGKEEPGLYIQPVEGGPLVTIHDKPGIRTSYVWISNDSETIYYTANDQRPDSYAFYAYSIPEKKAELLFGEPGLWSVVDARSDHVFLLSKSTGARTREYYTFDTRDKKLTPLLGVGEKEECYVQFGHSYNDYIVLTSRFGNFQRLYRWSEGKFAPITPDVKMDIDTFSVDFRRFRLYVEWNDNGRSRLQVYDAKTFEPIRYFDFDGADQVSIVGTSRYGRYASISVGTSLAPRTSYIFDWSNGQLTQWVRPSLPEVDVSKFAKTTIETYPAQDGIQIPMLVTRPATCAADPCPVVVDFHGGPESQSQLGFNRSAQAFVSSGFIYVQPNIRGSDGYGKEYREADNGPKRLQVITDIPDCAKYIKSAWAKDGRAPKVGVMGGSYGGYATLMAMSRFAGSYDAGVSIVGISNLNSFLQNTAPYRVSLRTSEYGDPATDREVLEQLSPTSYLDQVRDPLLIIQGANDPRVPAGEALQMHKRLKARGVEAPLILFPDEGHGTKKRANQVLELGHTLSFFKEHLLK